MRNVTSPKQSRNFSRKLISEEALRLMMLRFAFAGRRMAKRLATQGTQAYINARANG